MSAMKKRANALIWVCKRRINEREAGAAVMSPHSALLTTSAVRAGWLSPRRGSAGFLRDTFQLNTSDLSTIASAGSAVSPVFCCGDAAPRAACGKSKLPLESEFGPAERIDVCPAGETTKKCFTGLI